MSAWVQVCAVCRRGKKEASRVRTLCAAKEVSEKGLGGSVAGITGPRGCLAAQGGSALRGRQHLQPRTLGKLPFPEEGRLGPCGAHHQDVALQVNQALQQHKDTLQTISLAQAPKTYTHIHMHKARTFVDIFTECMPYTRGDLR